MTLLTKYATNDLQIVHQNISFHQKNKQLVLHEADSRLDGFYTLAERLRNSTFLPIQTQVKHKTDFLSTYCMGKTSISTGDNLFLNVEI